MYSRMVYLFRSSTPLARDSTTAVGTFSLPVPSSDSVLVIADADLEDDPVYGYRMVNARTNVNFELDMSGGQCGAHATKIASLDSAALSAPEDSILDEGGWPNVVLPNGDTIKLLDGAMMDAGASKVYGFDRYRKNSTQYLRIQRIVGYKPPGNLDFPVWLTRARLRLPPMDSTDVVTEGLCRINGKSDPSILAIRAKVGDSVHFHARHAWRFDRATETLREIPTAGVTCALPHGDPD
jgi:hypothetical protein